ncbi:MAG TPA: prolyl oligopeptidase family serine peptidase, partial [Thermoguttaceae bacterium]|nr:prolyl oligopeptidase family serine peptidase [Thermoguttaceae bacterium]
MRVVTMHCRTRGNLPQHGTSRGTRIFARCFGPACLLVPAAWFLMLAAAVADEHGILQAIGESARAAKPHAAVRAEKPGTLVEVTERPDGFDTVVNGLPYPKTDDPHKLTLEQLEAIAKLPPRINRSGMRVHPAMIPLFRDMVLYYSGGDYDNEPIHFRLHVPDRFEKGKKYPLVVWLHGAGECGSDNINQLGHLHHMIPSLVGPKKRDFFLLVSQCPHTHVSWEAPQRCMTTVLADGSVECHTTDDPVALGNAPISFTLDMVEAVMKKYPVDPGRVTVAGLSTGGEGTWKMLERRPDLFAAAVPIVSWRALSEKSLREEPLLKKIPIWAIYSSDDSGIDYARKEFQRLRDQGCRVFKTEFGVCGHRAWTPAMLQGDIFGWLISRAKAGRRYYEAEPAPTGPEKIGIFADVTEGDLASKPTLAPPKQGDAKIPPQQPLTATPWRPSDTKKSGVYTGTVRTNTNTVTTTVTSSPSWGLFRPTTPSTASSPAAPPPQYPHSSSSYPSQSRIYTPSAGSTPTNVYWWTTSCVSAGPPTLLMLDQLRVELVLRYLAAGDVDKALVVADKVKHHPEGLLRALLNVRDPKIQRRVLDYVDQRLDQLERSGGVMIRQEQGRVVFPSPITSVFPQRP